MILVIGQAVTFLLILQAALAIEAVAVETAAKGNNSSRMSLLEFTSVNVMLDCCHRLNALAKGEPEPTVERISSMAEGWVVQVEEHLCSIGMSCAIDLREVTVEPLANQTIDPLQMGFLGLTEGEHLFIAGMLSLRLSMGPFSYEAIYSIRIAA